MYRLKMLITGISGFIGRSLVEEIVDRNLPWDIYGIDIKEPIFNDLKYLEYIDFKMVDIRDKNAVESYFRDRAFDGVIHLAAVSRVVDAENDKENCIATNLYGTRHVVESVARQQNTWLIFGSSREVYGEQSVMPVSEAAEKKPVNTYGECKLEGERIVKRLISRYVILRFSNVYGNSYDIDGRVIPTFVKRALNGEPLFLEGGAQVIDFTYIDDNVDSIIKAVKLLEDRRLTTEELHISPGVENKITDVIAYLEGVLEKRLDVVTRQKRNYDVVRFIGDPQHRIEVLGEFRFKSLSEGIQLYLASLTNCSV